MNTYTTTCETRGCYEFLQQRAESFDAAIAELRSRGWFAKERDENGYQSFCPSHNPDGLPVHNCMACGKDHRCANWKYCSRGIWCRCADCWRDVKASEQATSPRRVYADNAAHVCADGYCNGENESCEVSR